MTNYKYYHGPAEGEFYRVHLEQDPDAASPREADNVSTLVTWESHYFSPDCQRSHGDMDVPLSTPFPSEYTQPRSYGGIDLRRIRKYAALFLPEILFVTGLERGPFGGAEGGLALTDDENRACGIAYVTAEDWKMCMGDSPLEGDDRFPSLAAIVGQDIDAYNNWAAGEYVGYVVERAHRWTDADGERTYTWDDTDMACWGIDDREYAWQSAFDEMPTGTYQLGPDESAELAE